MSPPTRGGCDANGGNQGCSADGGTGGCDADGGTRGSDVGSAVGSCDTSNGMGSTDTRGSCEGVEDPKCMGAGNGETSEKERVYIARPRIGKEMENRCVPTGCTNAPSDRVSWLKLPSDGILRRKWKKKVQRTLAQWKAI